MDAINKLIQHTNIVSTIMLEHKMFTAFIEYRKVNKVEKFTAFINLHFHIGDKHIKQYEMLFDHSIDALQDRVKIHVEVAHKNFTEMYEQDYFSTLKPELYKYRGEKVFRGFASYNLIQINK